MIACNGSAVRNERGAAAIIVAVSTVFMVAVVAFVTDFGTAYTNKRILQNGVDAAALAAAHEITVTAESSDTCLTIEATLEGATRSTAKSQFIANGAAKGGVFEEDLYDVSCAPSGSGAVEVTVVGTELSPNFFGGVAGRTDGIELEARARAAVGPAGVPYGVRPLALCRDAAWETVPVPGELFTYVYDNDEDACGESAGNWGVVSFDGSNNSTGEWLQNGYTGSMPMTPEWVSGDPGVDAFTSADARSALQGILDEEIVVPVYEEYNGEGGNNSALRIVGFVGVKICAWKTGNGSGQSATGSCADESELPSGRGSTAYFQLEYVRVVPQAELADCALGDTTCDFGLRVVKLTE